MPLKKYNEEEVLKKEEETKKLEEEATNKLQATIEVNSKKAEELNAIPLREDQETIKANIEKARGEYFTETKKQRRINIILTIVIVVILIAAFVLMITLSATISYINYISNFSINLNWNV